MASAPSRAVTTVQTLKCLFAAQAAETSAANQQPESFEIDQWIVDFAQLFREQLGVDPDKHLDLTNVAWEKLQVGLLLTC